MALSLFVATSHAWSDGNWRDEDVGSVGVAGSYNYDGATGVHTIQGSGDIWYTSDRFHFVYQVVQGDGILIARLVDQQYTGEFAKAGPMVRGSMDPGSVNAFLSQTPGRGINFQWRVVNNANSGCLNPGNNGAPVWMKLIKHGSIVSGYDSPDGDTWVCRGVIQIPFKGTVDFGLAVSSQDDDALSTATFDNLTLTTVDSFALPDPWLEQDIGTISIAGGAYQDKGQWELFASGKEIWGKADAFHYVYQPLNGDGSITARVNGMTDTDASTEVGIMLRETNAADSTHAALLLTAERGAFFLRRTSPGTEGTDDHFSAISPLWLRLVRQGDTITSYTSTDGTNWKMMGKDSVKMANSVEVGLALASHNVDTLAEASFDHVSVVTGPPNGAKP